MPMAQRYYSSKDVQNVLGCSKSYANQIMHMFDANNKMIRLGRSMRIEAQAFETWLEELKGATA